MASLHISNQQTYPQKISFCVVFLLVFSGVVDESKSAAAATSELGLKSENGDSVGLGSESLGELLLDSLFLDIWHVRVDHLNRLIQTSHKVSHMHN